MSKEDVIFRDTKIKYKGIFDLNLLYKKLREWVKEAKYSDPAETGETKYAERVKPNGKQLEIVWQTSRKEEGGYFKLTLEIKFFINGLTEVEVEREGRKIKLDSAEPELYFSSSVIRNADNQWDENSLMFKFYEKYIIPDKIEGFKIDSYKDASKIMDEVKNFFSLYRF